MALKYFVEMLMEAEAHQEPSLKHHRMNHKEGISAAANFLTKLEDGQADILSKMSPDDAAILLEQIVAMDCQMDTSVTCKAFVTLATDEHSTFLDSEDNDPQKPGWCKGYCGRSKPIGWKASQVLEKMNPVHAAILLEKIEELDWTLRKQDYVGSALKCMDPSCAAKLLKEMDSNQAYTLLNEADTDACTMAAFVKKMMQEKPEIIVVD